MPVLPSSAYNLASDVTAEIRAKLGDQAGAVFGDQNFGSYNSTTGQMANGDLQPYLNSAYRDLALELVSNGDLSVIQDDYEFILPATLQAPNQSNPTATGADASLVVINDTSNPQLPTDLLVPTRLFEKSTSGTDRYIQMAFARGVMPDVPISSNLRYWRWSNDQLEFLGATQDRMVKMEYEKSLSIIGTGSTALNTPIQIRLGIAFLAEQCCYYATRARTGQQSAAGFQANAQYILGKIINANVRGQQSFARRRAPYGRRRRVIWL